MNRSIGVTIPLALVLLAFLVFVACTPDAGNSARNTTGNREETVAAAPPPNQPNCKPNDPAANRARDMNQHFSQNANTGDKDVDDQRGPNFLVEFDVEGKLVVARLKGTLVSKENGGALKPRLHTLVNHLEKYIKKGCADLISFETKPNQATSLRGFEWVLCEGGEVQCPNGRCSVQGQCILDANSNVSNRSNSNAARPPSVSNTNNSSNSNTNSRSGP